MGISQTGATFIYLQDATILVKGTHPPEQGYVYVRLLNPVGELVLLGFGLELYHAGGTEPG